ncbi:MAG: glycoside hydrolase family 38 C-terminal domain-containing protein, partial [Clostridiales bacterium]|nr:glycoside hydrolase family 38 C-terminal domain-containing protein [Clostridiales bacterium]
RIETSDSYVMENDFIKVAFNTNDASILSFIDKRNNTEMVDKNRPSGIFRLIHEDDGKGMTAWIVGRYMDITNLNRDVKIGKVNLDGNSLRQWISYEIIFESSKLKAIVSLDKNSSRLNYDVISDWKEIAEKGRYIPQLNFHMPMGYKCEKYMYDIPFGTIERDGTDMDVPANSWVAGIPKERSGSALMLVTATKYGFRGMGDSMSITLIRSSYDPDPYPEYGIHKFRFAVGIENPEVKCELVRHAFNYNHPLNFISSVVHNGTLPLVNSFLSLEGGNIAISSVKMPEENNGCNRLIIRVYETEGVKAQAALKFNADVVKAYFTDINEKTITIGASIRIERNIVEFEVEKYSVASVCVEF